MNHSKTISRFQRPQSAGFTLVEMAVVVVIIGILMAMGLAMTNSMMQNTQRATTKDKSDYVRDALIAYFAANHRLPCPDMGSNTGNTGRDGVEDRVGSPLPPLPPLPFGDPTTACRTVAGLTGIGTIPYVTLGIAREKAIDGYGNFITYRLDYSSLPGARNWHLTSTFQVPAGTPLVPCNPPGIIAAPVAGLSVFSSPPPSPPPPTVPWAVVLISHGPNGLGAFNQGITNASKNTPPANAAELGNTVAAPAAPAGYRAYVYSDSAASPFDDVVQQLGLADLQTVMLTKMGRTNICN